MTTSITKMNFCKQDEKLLHYLHQVKVASYKQINRDIYPDYHIRSVCNRVYRLENNRFLQGYCNRMFHNGQRLISLTKHGFNNFVANGLERRIELRSDAVEHDLTLVDIRNLLLQSSRVLSYYSENQLQTWPSGIFCSEVSQLANLNSDGVITLEIDNETLNIPVEYEASSKSSHRYEPLLKRYYSRDDVHAVLYLCENQGVLNKIAKIEEDTYPSEQPKFFYKLISKLWIDEAMKFENYHGFGLKLN